VFALVDDFIFFLLAFNFNKFLVIVVVTIVEVVVEDFGLNLVRLFRQLAVVVEVEPVVAVEMLQLFFFRF